MLIKVQQKFYQCWWIEKPKYPKPTVIPFRLRRQRK